MSAGLMSCVRESSPPNTMENSGAASLSSDSQVENQKRRRGFLRNLRRIFRRRTLTHADAIRPIVKNHHYYHHHHHHHHNSGAVPNQQYKHDNDLSTISTIRSLSSQSIEDDVLPSDLCDFQSAQIIRPSAQSNLLIAGAKRSYPCDEIFARAAARRSQLELDGDMSRESNDYQRSLSEGRLIDNESNRDTLSHSHDSVFSESATASSLSIVLKAELANALRKRKCRSDASDEDLGLPRSPSTPPRNGNHQTVDHRHESINNAGNRQQYHHHGSMGLLGGDSPEMYDSMDSPKFLSNSKSSYDLGKYENGDEIFPPEMSLNLGIEPEVKLSHSAAKHRMAIRPKKKGPSRPSRKPMEVLNILPSTPEVNENGFRSSINNDSFGLKSQSLPRGIVAKALEQQANATTATTIATKKTFSTKSLSKKYDFDDSQNGGRTIASSVVATKTETKREERTNSEEGFFRRFINRSGRKQKKVQKDPQTDKDTVDGMRNASKAEQSSAPAIKKSDELSIINVLSKARASDTLFGTKAPSSEDQSDKSSISAALKHDKPKSGPASRQRITPKDVDIIKPALNSSTQKSPISGSPKASSPQSSRQELATSFLRFSPPKSIENDADTALDRNAPNRFENNYISSTHYRSEEILNSVKQACDDMDFDNETSSSPYSVSLPKSIWPSEGKFMQNTARNSYGWGQCQQKISKLANDQHQNPTKPTSSRGKMVEKSKSFRLYTKNCSNEATTQSLGELKSTSTSNMPSLPDLNSNNPVATASNRSSRYSSNRDSMQSLRFLSSSRLNANTNANTKWMPTRSSSSSRISDHASSRKYELSDFSLLPNNEALSPLSISDSESNNNSNNNPNVLVTPKASTYSSSHHSVQNPDINEIEDNIDKIMKSSVVTVLKKSPTADLYQIKTNTGNVSLTTITNSNYSNEPLNVATVENPPLLRNSMTTSKLDIPLSSSPPKKLVSNVPEFMQIQLNRVDAARPKSCYIEYSSSASSTITPIVPAEDDKERRFSNESIEISDKKKVAINTSVFSSNPNLNKSTESLKSSFSRQSRTSISSQQLSRGSSISDINKSPTASGHHSSDDCLDNSDDNANDRFMNNDSVIVERRRSVSDKKLKFEKKIEEIQAEVKRSSVIGIEKSVVGAGLQKSSGEEDHQTPVILRSKKPSSGLTSKSSDDSDDPTPELMKVFARRSLKIKDTDEYIVHDDDERKALNQQMHPNDSPNNANPTDDSNNNLNKLHNSKNVVNKTNLVDSDKENQITGGGSVQKSLDEKVPKVSVHIKSTLDADVREKGEVFRKDPRKAGDTDATPIVNRTSKIPNAGKFFSSANNRTSNNSSVNTNNYRNSSAFFENLNFSRNLTRNANNANATNHPGSASQVPNNGVVLIIDNENSNKTTDATTKTGPNLFGNNNYTKKNQKIERNPNANGGTEEKLTTTNNNNINNNNNNNKSNSKTNNHQSNDECISVDSDTEYKGILERKAEWEKRASQAFK